MLAKITAKNQLTLPKRVVQALGSPTYLEVEVQDGRLILTPLGLARPMPFAASWRRSALQRRTSPTRLPPPDASTDIRAVFDTNILVSALVFSVSELKNTLDGDG